MGKLSLCWILLIMGVRVLNAAVPPAIPTVGLQAWYSFNGNANNEFSGSFNGTVNGPISVTDRFGSPNSAYSFDGVDDFINLGTSILSGASNAAVSCWMKTNRFTVIQNVFQKRRQSNGDGYYLAIFNNFMYAGLNREPGINVNPSYTPFTSFSDTSWTHLVLNNNNGVLTLYVNGILFNQVTLPAGALVGSQPFYIGRGFDVAPDASGNRSFQGLIDDVGIWNRTLTAQEITNIYTATTLTTYYSKSSGSINLLSTWGTNADGSGTSPLSFDSSNTIYNIVNGNTTLTGDFNIGGNNSVIVFGNGSTAATFSIAAGDTLSVDSVYLNNMITLSVSGGLHSNRLASGSGSTAQYISNLPQRIAAGTYENLIVSSALKTMFGDVTVRGTLGMLTSINAQTFELTLGTSPTVRGTLNRTAGTVSGRFSRWFLNATNAGTTGLFPIGNFSRYAPTQIEFTSAPTTGGKLTCEYISGSAGSNGLPLFDFTNGFIFLDKVSPEGIVRLSASQGITGGTYTVSYTANSYPGVNIYSNLRLIYRSVGGSWTTFGSAGTNTGSNSSATLVRTGLTSLSGEFGVGGDQSENPLPVKFASIKATKIDNSTISIKWRTSFEYNASHFVVQRSTDKNYWVNLNKVPAQGNSLSTVNYQYTDYSTNHRGVIYYRLIQVDLDGKTDLSPVTWVETDDKSKAEWSIYPNPSNGKFSVTGLNEVAELYDIAGKKIADIFQDGSIDLSELPNGMYILRTSTQTHKIIKK